MYVRRTVLLREIWRFNARSLIIFSIWSSMACAVAVRLAPYGYLIGLPYTPLGTLGIAVAFYLGFKNSQSYDRLWEARKIWGGIVNASRNFANEVLSYVTPTSRDPAAIERLVFRHLAYVNSLRLQLRQTAGFGARSNVPDLGLPDPQQDASRVREFLPKNEADAILQTVNPATHMLRAQGRELGELCNHGELSEFRQIALMETLRQLYELQGRCERIKNTPFPRQYGSFATIFVWIFVLLLPFGLISELREFGPHAIWLAVPLSVLISWFFMTMEIVGDTSEDPFENYVNDVPMTALCRSIEVDLRQLLGNQDLPAPIEPINNVLL